MGSLINFYNVVLFIVVSTAANKCYHSGLQYNSAATLAISCTSPGSSYELHTGDFNGDGRSDIYCHDTTLTEPDWFALATLSGTYYTIQENGAKSFCDGSIGRVLVGDFNGDGRDDLLCQYHDGKQFSISYFERHTFSSGMRLFTNLQCDRMTSVLAFGDFNNDRRADLVCLNQEDGTISMIFEPTHYRGRRHVKPSNERHHGDYEDPRLRVGKNGVLNFPYKFCQGSTKKFVVGHFSNDRLADLGCFDYATGEIEIALANSGKKFHKSVVVSISNTFCANPATDVFAIEDVNGDNMDDLICLTDNNGNVDEEIFYTTDRLQYNTNKLTPSVFIGTCTAGEVKFGDFNGDGLADVACDSVSGGNDFMAEFATCAP